MSCPSIVDMGFKSVTCESSLQFRGTSFYLVVNDLICITQELIQFRFPKSKKKRIRNKWSKRMDNFKMQQVDRVLSYGRNIYVSQKMYDAIESGFITIGDNGLKSKPQP